MLSFCFIKWLVLGLVIVFFCSTTAGIVIGLMELADSNYSSAGKTTCEVNFQAMDAIEGFVGGNGGIEGANFGRTWNDEVAQIRAKRLLLMCTHYISTGSTDMKETAYDVFKIYTFIKQL